MRQSLSIFKVRTAVTGREDRKCQTLSRDRFLGLMLRPAPLGNEAREGGSGISQTVAVTIMLARRVGDKIMKTAVPWVLYGQPQARCHKVPRTQGTQSCSSELKAIQRHPGIDQP